MPIVNGVFVYDNGGLARQIVASSYTPISTDVVIGGTLYNNAGFMYQAANLTPGGGNVYIDGVIHTKNGVRGTAITGGTQLIRGFLHDANGNAIVLQAAPTGNIGPWSVLSNGTQVVGDTGSSPSDPTAPMYEAWIREFEVTAGDNGSLYGYVDATFGTVTPDPPLIFNGQEIKWITTRPSNDRLVIRILTSADEDETFQSITISGTFTGGADVISVLRSDRVTYTTEGGGTNEWEFDITSDQHFVNGNVYDVVFVGIP